MMVRKRLILALAAAWVALCGVLVPGGGSARAGGAPAERYMLKAGDEVEWEDGDWYLWITSWHAEPLAVATLSSGGVAVTGYAPSLSGTTCGILGQVDSDDGYAGYFSGGRGLFVVGDAATTGQLISQAATGTPPLSVISTTLVTHLNADLLDGLHATAFWKLAGNAGTTPGTHFLGTTDDQALELHVNGARALRLEPAVEEWSGLVVPNVIGGHEGNTVTAGVTGATIGGGGYSDQYDDYANVVSGDWGTVGGGLNNDVAGVCATVGGGADNEAAGQCATVGGGDYNAASDESATVAGGQGNTASRHHATVGGGKDNEAAGLYATVGGGRENEATGGGATVGGGGLNRAEGWDSAIAGGGENIASGSHAAIPGGRWNAAAGQSSLAAGFRAKANDTGAFVWADMTHADFASSAPNQFLIRAAGGVGIGTNSPAAQLDVNGTGRMTGFEMPTGAIFGHVLTSDGSGVGTWKPLPPDQGDDADADPTNELNASLELTGTTLEITDAGGTLSADLSSVAGWSLTGNAGTTAGTQFLGTTDSQALVVKTNGAERLRVAADGKVGIGTTAPSYKLDVNGDIHIPAYKSVVFSDGDAAIMYEGANNRLHIKTTVGDAVDQAQTHSNAQHVSPLGSIWQSFTAGVSGQLTKIDVQVQSSYELNSATLRVYQGEGTDGTLLGTTTGINVGDGWHTITLSSSVAVSSGSKYTFRISQDQELRLRTATGNPYPGGRSYYFPDTDLAFRTYVTGTHPSITICDNGNVGIGTTSPSHPLHMASGAHVTAAGVWSSVSDRNVKENFHPVDGRAVLGKLLSVPVSTWNYKTEDDSIRHMGPMAQDLHAAFGLGDSDKSIGTIDADGIALAAIQGLHQVVQEKEARIAELEARLAKLEALVAGATQQQTQHKE